MKRTNLTNRITARSAFTIVEAVIGAAFVGIVFFALYSGMTAGFNMLRLARETVGANQVLTEKFETIRLYNWDQINSNNFIPKTFVVPIDAALARSSQNYSGTVTIANAPITEAYSNDMRLVTVSVSWMCGNRVVTRSRQSFVARYGLQDYVY